MAKYGDYTDGSNGQATDVILVKRGSTTVRTTLDQLPIPSAVSENMASKADTTAFNNALNELNADLDAVAATKQDTLTFFGAIQKSGNNVTVDPFIAAGSILDGRSNYAIPGTTTGSFITLLNSISIPVFTGTVTNKGPGTGANPSVWWHTLNRISALSAAAINSQAKFSWQPRIRFPLTETNTLGGFRVRVTHVINDAVSGASAIGMFQTMPSAGTSPSAYTGGRVYLYHDKGDTAWKLAVNSTLVATLDNAVFPVNNNTSNPFQVDIICTPYPNWGITVRIKHLVSFAEVTHTYTGTFGGGFDPHIAVIRDTIDGTTAVQVETSGFATGCFVEAVQGEPAAPVPNTLTASATISRVPHANVDNFVNSATPVTLTIPATGFSPGDYFYGTNIGAGEVTIAGSGFTISKHANVTATLEQFESFSCVCVANGNWVRLS